MDHILYNEESETEMFNGRCVSIALATVNSFVTLDGLVKYFVPPNRETNDKDLIKRELKRILDNGVKSGFVVRNRNKYKFSSLVNVFQTDDNPRCTEEGLDEGLDEGDVAVDDGNDTIDEGDIADDETDSDTEGVLVLFIFLPFDTPESVQQQNKEIVMAKYGDMNGIDLIMLLVRRLRVNRGPYGPSNPGYYKSQYGNERLVRTNLQYIPTE